MKLLFLILASILISGCVVQSIGPYGTKDNLAEVPLQIIGKWKAIQLLGDDVSDKSLSNWEFLKDGVTSFDSSNTKCTLVSQYFKINNELFCSIAANNHDNINGLFQLNTFPVVTCHKVIYTKDDLIFIPLNFEKIKKLIANKELNNFVRSGCDGNLILFTEPPETWSTILRKYSNDNELFDTKLQCKFTKVETRVETPVKTND